MATVRPSGHPLLTNLITNMSPFKGKYQKELHTTEFLEVGRRALPMKKYRIIKVHPDKRVILHVGLSRDTDGELHTDVRTILVPDTVPQHVEWIYRVSRPGTGPDLAPGWATVNALTNNNAVSNDRNSIISIAGDSTAPAIERYDGFVKPTIPVPGPTKVSAVQTNGTANRPVSK